MLRRRKQHTDCKHQEINMQISSLIRPCKQSFTNVKVVFKRPHAYIARCR